MTFSTCHLLVSSLNNLNVPTTLVQIITPILNKIPILIRTLAHVLVFINVFFFRRVHTEEHTVLVGNINMTLF